MNRPYLFLIILSITSFLLNGWDFLFTKPAVPVTDVSEIVLTVCGGNDDINYSTAATFTAVQNGRWDAATTWNQNSIPTANDLVVIPAGLVIRLVGTCRAKNIRVNGILMNLPGMNDFDLATEYLLVTGSGAELRAGTAGSPYTGRGIITLVGNNDGENILGSGDKFIASMNQGKINIHGENTVSWTQLGANASQGSNQITLKEPVTWPVGAEIVVVSSRTDWNEAEKKTITAVSADQKTLTLASALAWPHTGVQKTYTRTAPAKSWTADLRAEVGLLSHNITIQGDAASDATNFGGHIMVHFGATAYISGAELYRMGQTGILGRYPFHWHLVKAGGAGQYFKNNSVHKSFSRAVTIHGTDYSLVENNFCYDHIGHGIFLEDGGERFNTIRKNVVLLTKRPTAAQALTPSDHEFNQVQNRTPSSYWITNPNNIFEDNVAAGTQGTGYWFAMPTSPMADSGGDPYYSSLEPHKEPLGSFSGNVAHSCMSGFDIFDQLNPDHSIKKNWGWDNPTPHVMENCTWYSNNVGIYAGIGSGGPMDNVIYRNNVMVDNVIHLFLATYNLVDESVIVANAGEGLRDKVTPNTKAYRTYDGAGRVSNTHFVGWDEPNTSFILPGGAATKHVNHEFTNITTDHTGYMNVELFDYSVTPPADIIATHYMHPRSAMMVVHDNDGSITGAADASLVSNHPMMLTGGEFQAPNWTNAYRSSHRWALAFMLYPGVAMTNFPDVTIERTKPGTPDAGVYYVDGYREKHQVPFIVNDGFMYTYHYETLPSSKQITLYMDDATPGDRFLIRYKDFGKLGGFVMTGAVSHGSLANLLASNTTGYYREPNGDIYVQTIATGLRTAWSMYWVTNYTVAPVDLDGDGSTDGFEAAWPRNPFDASDLAFQYSTTNDFEGWNTLSQITSADVSGGWLNGVTSGGDPKIIKTDFNFDATKVVNILVKMKATSNRVAQLFWGRNDAPGFAAARVVSDNYTGNGDWEIVVFQVAAHAEWFNNITSMRLDPTNLTGVALDIDWIIASDGDYDDDGIPDTTDDCIAVNQFLNFTGDIPEGTHLAGQKITTNGDVLSGTTVRFEAPEIEMEVGFEAQLNSDFDSVGEGCPQ